MRNHDTCCVIGCSKKSNVRFPKDELQLAKWRLAIRRQAWVEGALWRPLPGGYHVYICDLHFLPGQLEFTRITLDKHGEEKEWLEAVDATVVPSLFPTYPLLDFLGKPLKDYRLYPPGLDPDVDGDDFIFGQPLPEVDPLSVGSRSYDWPFVFRKCFLPGCPKFALNKNLFRSFPTEDKDLCLEWIKAIDRRDTDGNLLMPKQQSVICLSHFKDDPPEFQVKLKLRELANTWNRAAKTILSRYDIKRRLLPPERLPTLRKLIRKEKVDLSKCGAYLSIVLENVTVLLMFLHRNCHRRR